MKLLNTILITIISFTIINIDPQHLYSSQSVHKEQTKISKKNITTTQKDQKKSLDDRKTSETFTANNTPWWVWPLVLFVFCFCLGLIAVMAGVGGGVLFVPIVGTFFPFHMDFVRGASLMVALSGALAAAPSLIKKGLASFRLVLPMGLLAAAAAIAGAQVGLALPENIVRITLGCAILGIVYIMLRSKRTDFPEVNKADKLSQVMGIYGLYYDESLNKEIEWKIHRTYTGFILFLCVGFLAGMFGLGAGWANVPVFNLILGAPLKIAVGSSIFLLSISDTAAAWIYFNKGAVDILIAVPSVLGMILGTRIGVKLLSRSKPQMVRYVVLTLLGFSGLSSLLKGVGVFG